MEKKKIYTILDSMLKSGSVDEELLIDLSKNDLVTLVKMGILEFNNLYNITNNIKPKSGSIPEIKGFDIYGNSKPLTGIVGGDHIIYIDFNKRFNLEKRFQKYGNEEILENKKRAGILLADVSGHSFSDSALAAQFHQAFLLGVQYELKINGRITTHLFEELNTRFARSSRLSPGKYITVIYGEIYENGIFKYISAGHPTPIVFSNEFNKIVDIGEENKKTGGVIGFMPSKGHIDADKAGSLGLKDRYELNTIKLYSPGDILIMYSDGLLDINNGESHIETVLEEKLKEVKHLKARRIYNRIYQHIVKMGINDDLTYVVIKRES